MLYTGNVNKLLWYIIIPALIIFYFLFRVWVFVNFDDGDRTKIANTHISKLQSLKVLNGLILGGSNSYFSLVFLCFMFCISCTKVQNVEQRISGSALGTTYQIIYFGNQDSELKQQQWILFLRW